MTIAEELVILTEQVFNTISARVMAGKVSPVEKTKASIPLSTSQIKVQKARKALEAARIRLSTARGDTSATFERAEGDFHRIASIPSL